jgi:heme exporter protein B
MNALICLIKKEFLQEFRTKEVSAIIISLSLLLSVLSAIGVQLAFFNLEQVQKIAPLLIWLSFLFSATSAIGRSFDFEIQYGALDGLKLAGVPFPLVFLSKVITSALLLLLSHLISVVALCILLDLSLALISAPFVILSLVVIVAYTALATLFSAVAATSRMRGVLLPLILFPLLFPLFFAALEVTGDLIIRGQASFGSFWFSFAGLLALVYFLLGLNLYQYVVEE